ncbi:MAG: hypothetical protein RQ826_14645, partial [Xanthomonadales bacterium]|nr:hypothetical protein [Xanthomonadales bacterium]
MRPFEHPVKFTISRRELLRLLLPMAAWLPAPLMLLAARDSQASAQPAAFGPFLDTLLPGDGAPSATSLGVDRQLLEQAQSDPQLDRLIAAGCAWLDQQAQGLGYADYAGLDQSRRILVVSRAERSRERSLPKVFFAALLGGSGYLVAQSGLAITRMTGLSETAVG